jgi:hypothetical protein
MQQMSLSFEQGLAQRYRSVRDVMATGVYQRGLTTVAGKIDLSPSKLTEKLAGGGGDRARDIGLTEFERYLEESGDTQPIYYLIDRFLRDPAVQQQEAIARLAALAEQLAPLMEAAGMVPKRARAR